MLSKFTSLKNITLQFKRPYVGLMGAPSNYHFSSMKASYLNLKIKTKFTNNPRINPLFKSASTDGYVTRHIGNDPQQTTDIMEALGVENMEQLIYETVPD